MLKDNPTTLHIYPEPKDIDAIARHSRVAEARRA